MGVILCFCGSGKTYDNCCQQVDRSVPPEMISRQEAWHRYYKQRRYLEYMSAEELAARGDDIITNSTTLLEDLKIGFQPPEESGEIWMRMLNDILSEGYLRNKPYPYPFDHAVSIPLIPDYEWPELLDAVAAFKKMNLRPNSFWIKFGKYQFLKNTLAEGKFRISAASSFTQAHLNEAQRDQELEISFYGLPSETRLEAADKKTGKSKGFIYPKGYVKFTMKAPTDYYACCLSSTFSHRLFGDFEADCALIIKKPGTFLNRLIYAFKEKLVGWNGEARPVDYFDPYGKNPAPPSVYFAKHFRYWYQQEYRVVWRPPTPIAKLPPLDVEMGNLEDICEIICLNK